MREVPKTFIEITLKTPSDFLVVRETLTRMGVTNNSGTTLFQSCHLLHKRGKFYITHFKEMFILDGKTSTLTDDDIERRNAIISLLVKWRLIDVVGELPSTSAESLSQVKVIPFREKDRWILKAKYTIGRKSQ